MTFEIGSTLDGGGGGGGAAGVASFNSRTGAVTPVPGDYQSFGPLLTVNVTTAGPVAIPDLTGYGGVKLNCTYNSGDPVVAASIGDPVDTGAIPPGSIILFQVSGSQPVSFDGGSYNGFGGWKVPGWIGVAQWTDTDNGFVLLAQTTYTRSINGITTGSFDFGSYQKVNLSAASAGQELTGTGFLPIGKPIMLTNAGSYGIKIPCNPAPFILQQNEVAFCYSLDGSNLYKVDNHVPSNIDVSVTAASGVVAALDSYATVMGGKISIGIISGTHNAGNVIASIVFGTPLPSIPRVMSFTRDSGSIGSLGSFVFVPVTDGTGIEIRTVSTIIAGEDTFTYNFEWQLQLTAEPINGVE